MLIGDKGNPIALLRVRDPGSDSKPPSTFPGSASEYESCHHWTIQLHAERLETEEKSISHLEHVHSNTPIARLPIILHRIPHKL